jgi:predicted phosphodiesterase
VPGRIRQFAAIGDVHGKWQLLERAIGASRMAGAEVIVCVGDIAAQPEATDRCVELLSSNGVVTVRGNHDRWLLEASQERRSIAATLKPETLRFLTDLHPTARLDTAIGEAFISHGVGANDLGHFPVTFLTPFMKRQWRLGRLPREACFVIHGHSHRSRVDVQEDVAIVSVGPLSEDASVGCVLVTVEERSVTPLRY